MATKTLRERKRVGWKGTCGTPYCGAIEGYFCVRCRHFTEKCACYSNYGGCSCPDEKFWAGEGERRFMEERLAQGQGR